MRLTGAELGQALDRAIDRGVRQVLADDWRMTFDRCRRLHDVIRSEVDELERTLCDNGQGVIRFEFDFEFHGIDPMPRIRVAGGRLRL